MIAYAGLSQRQYIVSGDTLTAYTNFENRSIAALLYKGMHYDTLCQIQANKLKIYGVVVAKYQSDSVLYSKKINTFTEKFDLADSSFNATLTKYNKEVIKTKRYKSFIIPSVGLNILFLILLL